MLALIMFSCIFRNLFKRTYNNHKITKNINVILKDLPYNFGGTGSIIDTVSVSHADNYTYLFICKSEAYCSFFLIPLKLKDKHLISPLPVIMINDTTFVVFPLRAWFIYSSILSDTLLNLQYSYLKDEDTISWFVFEDNRTELMLRIKYSNSDNFIIYLKSNKILDSIIVEPDLKNLFKSYKRTVKAVHDKISEILTRSRRYKEGGQDENREGGMQRNNSGAKSQKNNMGG